MLFDEKVKCGVKNELSRNDSSEVQLGMTLVELNCYLTRFDFDL